MCEYEGHCTEILEGDEIKENSKMTTRQNIWPPVICMYL